MHRTSPSTAAGRAGFTVWELLCTLAVAALALALGVPALGTFALDARRTSAVNAFVTAVQLARSEAAKRARPVALCASADLATCLETTDYAAGWIVFVNEDGVRPARRAPHEPLLYAHRPRLQGTIRSNRSRYEFRAFALRSTNGTVTFCDRRGASAARAVIVSYTGRPRVAAPAPTRPLACEAPP